jgi:hypothetical protein
MVTKRYTNSKRTYLHHWRRWRYKNTTLLILGLILFFYLVQTPTIDNAIRQMGTFGYIGAFITGMFFVSTFTAAPAALVLFNLADNLHPVEVALLAGLGAMLGDFLILRLMQDKVFDELKPIIGKLQHPYLRSLFKTPYFAWLLPVLGAIVIASPLPDEAGVSLLGLSKIKKWQFFAVTYVLNAVGIFVIVAIARL